MLNTITSLERPSIVLAQANTYRDPKRKKQVVKECEIISNIFHQNPDATFEILYAKPEAGNYLFDLLRKFRFREQAVFLHIAGFSDGEFLHLEGGWGEESLTPKQAARLLSRLPGLKMVFLNGCASPALLEELLLIDIPAIFATTENKNRKFSLEIAHTVYEALARGKTIQEAYEETQKSHAHLFMYKKVFYHLEKDQLLWDGREKAFKRNQLEWGLYVLEGNHKYLKTQYHQEALSSSLSSTDGSQRKRSRRIVSAMFALGLMATMLILLGQHPALQHMWSSYHEECNFGSQESYNILQYPFYEEGNCEHSDPFYNRAISRRIQQLEGKYGHMFSSNSACSLSLAEAEKAFQSCDADLVLWGNYRFPDAQTATVHFHYIYTGHPTVLSHGEREWEMPLHLFNQENDFIYSAVEDIVFWTQGMSQVEMEEYEEAIVSFQKMRRTDDTSYYVVDMQLARCYLYLKNFEQAKEHLDHLLKLQPTHVDSWYERGNIHLRMGNYAQARDDLDKAISLQADHADAIYSRGLLNVKTQQFDRALSDGTHLLKLRPQEGRTHGLLAIVHAETQNWSEAIDHLELGLQNGLEATSFFSSIPSLEQFKSDPAVQEILSQYR